VQAQGRLRIGAPQTFGALHLAALWGRFAAQNPQVSLDIVLQPDFLVWQDLRNGALVELVPQFKAVELDIFAVYSTRKQLPLKVRRLVDFLVEALQSPPWQTDAGLAVAAVVGAPHVGGATD
jgi:DNA-binding transcriptional LysR family regulator